MKFLGMLTDHELQTLCVPLDQCISVKTGKVDPGALAELEEHGYDQAPVYDAGGRVLYGLISTERLRTLQTSGGEIGEADIDVRDEGHFLYTGSFLTVDRLLAALSDRRAVFVARVSSATEYGYNQSNYG